ncbi:MAG: restriction endonuclease subunit S [Verrucomicrobiae bacterium]|nr:restriction endonuclease subunit S [Verrucomicrobiae bacterium]
MPKLSLNASKKTKHTPAGEIPVDWAVAKIGELCALTNGTGFGPKDWKSSGWPIIRIQNLNGASDFNYFDGTPKESWIVEPGDLLFAWAGTRGASFGPTIWNGPRGVLNQHIFKITPKKTASKQWLYLSLRILTDNIEKKAHGFKSTLLHVGKNDIIGQYVPLPPPPEQRRIADILSSWDRAIETLESLIAAKERRKQALMQQLLTGRKRLPRFDQSKGKTKKDHFETYPADWEHLRLGQIVSETGKRNSLKGNLPVLSCTKHQGLVLSEEYFGRRVHAEDTSNYRVVRRGEFAYATNHIEEGSIGYQDLCDAGLVSPIYTVFQPHKTVTPEYLFRVLKSPLFLHHYQANTSASVDRRGSLRFKEFAQLPIWLPTIKEQQAIAAVLDSADRELTLHRQHLDRLRTQKRGLMGKLLTGEVRVKP